MKELLRNTTAIAVVLAASIVLFLACYGLATILSSGEKFNLRPNDGAAFAGWIQAVGSICAILGAYVIGERQAVKARENALEVYHTERRRIDAGARGVVSQLFGELLSLKQSADQLSYDSFNAMWNSMLKGTSQASLDAFDHLPLHELGTASRVRIGFEMRGTLVDCTFRISSTLGGANDPDTDGTTNSQSTIELNNRRMGSIRTTLTLALARQTKLRDDFYGTYTTT